MPGQIRRMPGGRCTAIEGAMSPIGCCYRVGQRVCLGDLQASWHVGIGQSQE